MHKLSGANFARLKKSKVFWICAGGMFLFGVFLIFNQFRQMKLYGDDLTFSLNDNIFTYTMVVGILCAVFTSLFIGTEYSDGTIRNKLVIGHSRTAVYLSNLITCIAASLMMLAAFTVPVYALGIPLIGNLNVPAHLMAGIYLGSILMTAAFCSLFTLLGMNNQNKAAAAVIAILTAFALLMAASLIKSKLDAPEYWSGYGLSTETGEFTEQVMPNPEYLRGTKRVVYQTILDILPSGQGVQYITMEVPRLWLMYLYSAGIILISTGTGIILFRKKDIK